MHADVIRIPWRVSYCIVHHWAIILLARSENNGKFALSEHEEIFEILLPPGVVIARGELEVKAANDSGNDHTHFLHCEAFA
jgi:hypothetical protein